MEKAEARSADRRTWIGKSPPQPCKPHGSQVSRRSCHFVIDVSFPLPPALPTPGRGRESRQLGEGKQMGKWMECHGQLCASTHIWDDGERSILDSDNHFRKPGRVCHGGHEPGTHIHTYDDDGPAWVTQSAISMPPPPPPPTVVRGIVRWWWVYSPATRLLSYRNSFHPSSCLCRRQTAWYGGCILERTWHTWSPVL